MAGERVPSEKQHWLGGQVQLRLLKLVCDTFSTADPRKDQTKKPEKDLGECNKEHSTLASGTTSLKVTGLENTTFNPLDRCHYYYCVDTRLVTALLCFRLKRNSQPKNNTKE